MFYNLSTTNGGTEAVIDDNCGIKKFYAIADTLTEHLKIQFMNQIDDADSLDWDFKYKDQFLTLHYNIFNGVSIFPQLTKIAKRKPSDDVAVIEVANFLRKHIF